MDDLIYVLIGIAWVGYSIYSASKKSAAKRQSAGVPTDRTSTSSPLPIPRSDGSGRTLFEEIFSELVGEQKPVVPVPQPVVNQPQMKNHQKMQQTIETAGSFERIYTGSTPENKIQDIAKPVGKTYTNPVEETKHEGIARNFNLREAFIFSEILNRKYF